MQGMPGGMPGMQGTMGMQGNAHPFGMQEPFGDRQYEPPFTAANAQNTIANGSLSTTEPLQLANSPHQTQMGNTSNDFSNIQSSGGFGSAGFNGSGITMNNSTMSTMQGSPGYPNNQQPMPMQQGMGQMPMQGGMGMSNMGNNQMMEKISQMQMTMAQMAQMQGQMNDIVMDQRNYIEQRDSWLETRMSQLDRRCQKVEVLSDRLHTMLRSFDLQSLEAVPRDVFKALSNAGVLSPTSSAPGSPKEPRSPKALKDATWGSSSPASPPDLSMSAIRDANEPHHHQHHVGHHHNHRLEERIKQMSIQMDLLVSHAEATPQITGMLWKMDMNLRQLTQAANRMPAQPASSSPDKRSQPARQRGQSPGPSGGGGSGRVSTVASRANTKPGLVVADTHSRSASKTIPESGTL